MQMPFDRRFGFPGGTVEDMSLEYAPFCELNEKLSNLP